MPLKVASPGRSTPALSYELDVEAVLSFTDRCAGAHSLNNLAKQGNLETEWMEKAVFFSRFEAQLCFQVSELITAEASMDKPSKGSKTQKSKKISPNKDSFMIDTGHDDSHHAKDTSTTL